MIPYRRYSPRALIGMIRCNSEADSKVWMEEGLLAYLCPDFLSGLSFINYVTYAFTILEDTKKEDIKMKNVSKSTNLIIKIGLLGAIALILAFFQFPILPAFPFLKMDPSDIPALIGAFAFGPLVGGIIEALKNVLVFIFNNSGTGGVGEFANFMVGCFYVCTAGFIYSRNRTRKSAILSLIAATIFMSVAGVLANYFIFVPMYYGDKPMSFIIHYLVYAIVPFNLIKGVIISVVTMLIYKRVSVLIHSEDMNNKMLADTKKSS